MTPREAAVDARLARMDQGVLALALVVGFVFQIPHVIPVWAAFLALSACGSRYAPWQRLFAGLVVPRLGPADLLEDPRPARSCAALGSAALALAGFALLLGWGALAWALALVVAGAGALASVGGWCPGCQLRARLHRRVGGVGRASPLGDR